MDGEQKMAETLSKYLATGEVPPMETAIVIKDDNGIPTDPMVDLMASLCAIGMVAKDLHYRASSRSFYGIHLLADLVGEVREFTDQINEVYYMGELAVLPPLQMLTCKRAIEIYNGSIAIVPPDEEQLLIEQLLALICGANLLIEEAKHKVKAAGTHAVLDEISKKLLTAKALLLRTQKLSPVEKDVKAPEIISVIE